MTWFKKILGRIPRWESRISFGEWLWRAGSLGVTLLMSSWATAMAWVEGVASQWGTLGYVAVFLFVALALSIVFLAISWAAWLWAGRKFRTNTNVSRPPSEVAHLTLSNQAPIPEFKVVESEIRILPNMFFIGVMTASAPQEYGGSLLQLSLTGYNASGREISVIDVRGHIEVILFDKNSRIEKKLGDIGPPRLERERGGAGNIKNFSTFFCRL